MKKMIFILVLSVGFLQSFGQKTRAGITTGFVLADFRGTVDGEDQGRELNPGFAAGMILDFPIGSSHFSLSPVIQYIQKGQVVQEAIENVQDKISMELRYAEFLFNILYNSNPAGNNFFAGVGPTLAFNLPSKKVTIPFTGNRAWEGVKFGNAVADNFRGVDFGANAVIGFRMAGGFFVSFNYTMGLRNLIPKESLREGDLKNTSFGLNLGFLLKNK